MQLNKRAICLLSGGLDSALSAKIVKDMGVEVFGLYINTPFLQSKDVFKVAKDLEIPLFAKGVTKEYLDILKNPKYGFGQGANPCIDCHILFLRIAKEYMKETNCSFIVTGDVVGQRPMTQYKKVIEVIDREAEVSGCVLRPLSAKLLYETEAERAGIVDRNKLFDIKGRSRKAQISLAKRFGIDFYTSPAGGCILCDPAFSRRVKDALKHDELKLEYIPILKVGRHFRINGKKLVVGRNEFENGILLRNSSSWKIIEATSIPSPIGLFRGGDEIDIACSIVLSYSDFKGRDKWYVKVFESDRKSSTRFFYVPPLGKDEAKKYLI